MRRQRLHAKSAIVALAMSLSAAAMAQTGQPGNAAEALVRANASKFHKNFSAGQFAANGPLVTEDVDVDSNNVKLVGRDAFVKRLERYSIPFPGLQLRDRFVIVDGNVAAVNYVLQGEQKGPYGSLAPTGNKVEAMSGEVMEFNPQGLMKKLITITELDRLKAEMQGAVRIDAFQPVTLQPNGPEDPAYRAKIKAAAAMFDRNFNDGHVERNASLAVEHVRINADNHMLEGGAALVQRLQRLRTAFPDMQIYDEYVLADGNRAAVEYVMDGAQRGPFTAPNGSVLSPTGKKVRVRGIDFMTFNEEGLLTDLVVVNNEDDFATQLTQ